MTPEAGAAAHRHTVEAEALKRVRPDAALLARVAEVREHLDARAREMAASRRFPVVRSLVAGSAARGTFLKDRIDLDFFLLFSPDVSRAELERMGLEMGAALLTDPETRYAEHPYRRGTFEGFTVDVVPGYAIEDPGHPLTAVDRTPFHNEYLRARQTPEMVDQVRLAKQFLRGLGVYGSEARRGGFSGYLVELLLLRFGTLDALLEDARSWRMPVRFLSRPGAAARVPEDVALVLDDPVDADRNVATALSRRNLGLFILAAGEFLDRPSERAFEPLIPEPMRRDDAERQVERRRTHITCLTLSRPPAVDDILYPQLRKAERAVADEATRLGFNVLGTSSAAGEGEVVVLTEVAQKELAGVRVQEGPPAGIDRTGDFLTKWSDPARPVLQGPYLTSEGRLAVDVERDERRIEPLLTATLGRLPIGKDLRDRITPTTQFVPLSETSESPHLDDALGDLLAKGLPWLPRPSS
ncbi:MAG TPA: CCA tRNA nucleotidyltransferase [Thermoplasmata archaeon]|nr:CCA tRNA nucleotidyltransferase [Thermoplasmata archaeon]